MESKYKYCFQRRQPQYAAAIPKRKYKRAPGTYPNCAMAYGAEVGPKISVVIK